MSQLNVGIATLCSRGLFLVVIGLVRVRSRRQGPTALGRSFGVLIATVFRARQGSCRSGPRAGHRGLEAIDRARLFGDLCSRWAHVYSGMPRKTDAELPEGDAASGSEFVIAIDSQTTEERRRVY